MMDPLDHHERFREVIERNGLEDKAEEISDFLLKRKEVSAQQFSDIFGISVDDAAVFLSFIKRGIDFKERTLDKN